MLYRNASFVGNNRVVFNIHGNKYRLITAINYKFSMVYIRFVGTHAEYQQSRCNNRLKEADMQVKPIKTAEDDRATLARIEQLCDAEPNTPEGDELEVLATLVEAFEEANYPIDAPDPIDAIKFRMEQQGLEDKDRVPFLGQRSRVTYESSR